jgi:hypothetical protein
MCQPIIRNLTRNAIEAIDPVDSDFDELMWEAIGHIGTPTDQEIADAFDYEESETMPDICPSGCNGSGCFNCR